MVALSSAVHSRQLRAGYDGGLFHSTSSARASPIDFGFSIGLSRAKAAPQLLDTQMPVLMGLVQSFFHLSHGSCVFAVLILAKISRRVNIFALSWSD